MASFSVANSSDDEDTLFETENFVGVFGPFLAAANNPIRGVSGAGAAWVLDEIEAEVRADGTIIVEVEGLVLTSSGVNPIASFGAVLSCLVPSGSTVATVNLATGNFPATGEGDALIEAKLGLPSTCVAPIVFVTSPQSVAVPTGRWFAASGF